MKKIGIVKNPTQDFSFEDNLNDIVSSMATSKYSSYSNINEIQTNLAINDNDIIKRLNVNQIYPNPLNQKYMRGITQDQINILKESILSQGLMHNLVVIEDGNGMYKLISGEKRWTAISNMTDQEYKSTFPNDILCKVYTRTSETKDVDELLILLIANVITFSNGTPDLDQVRDLVRVYTELGYEKKQIMNYFQEQLKKPEATIREMVSSAASKEELYDLYDSGCLSKKALSSLGALKPDEQEKAFSIIKENYDGERLDDETVQQIKKDIKQTREVSKSTRYRRVNEAKEDTTKEYSKLHDILSDIKKTMTKLEKVDTKILKTVERESLMASGESLSRAMDFWVKNLANITTSNTQDKEK